MTTFSASIRRACFLAGLVPLLVCARVAWGDPPTDPQVDDRIEKLSADSFTIRENATKDLIDWLPMMTGAQIKKLRDAGTATNLEQRRRIEKILDKWTKTFKPVQRLLNNVVTKTVAVKIDPFGILPDEVHIQFDGYTGRFNGVNPVYSKLQEKYDVLHQSVTGGNLDKMIPAIQDLKAYVTGLTDEQVASLYLSMAIGGVTKDDMLEKIGQALNEATRVAKDLGLKSANAAPPAGPPAPVDGAGPVDVGSSLSLNVTSVLTAGHIETFSGDNDAVVAPPPDGYEFVGHVYLVFAVDSVAVSGPVTVGIEFGEMQVIGNPAGELSNLRMARMANGRLEILSDFTLDSKNYTLTATYAPDSVGTGLDQWGQFAVVQPMITKG